MAKWEVNLEGQAVEVHKFKARIEVEADTEEAAESKARKEAESSNFVGWQEVDDGSDPDEELEVEIVDWEVSELKDNPNPPDGSDKEHLTDAEADEQLRNQEPEEEQNEYLGET